MVKKINDNNKQRRALVIFMFDFLIALFAFWISRYFGDLPRWYWLVLSAGVWVVLSQLTRKLAFGEYKRKRFAFVGILSIDAIIGSLLFFIYRSYIDDYQYDFSIILAVLIIFVLEWFMYSLFRITVYRKIPFFYEEPMPSEGVEPINKTNISCDATQVMEEIFENLASKDFDHSQKTIQNLAQTNIILRTSPADALQNLQSNPQIIIHNKDLNEIRHINKLLADTNIALAADGFIICQCVTAYIRRDKLKQQMPRFLYGIANTYEYLIHRVIPKLPVLRDIYFYLTKGHRRSLTRVEILGRIYRAGFDVVAEKIVNGKFYLAAQKIKDPIIDDNPSKGVLIRLKRNGKDGKQIGVYKFRTMHAYSEYLQPYMYRTEGLTSDGGRYGNDYRVSTIGAFMRKTFIDELPMLLNWFRGDLKLVGFRPLSNHYLSLYTKEFQELRTKVKPGLIPPFYADKPESIEEKQESERRYINAYLKHPLRTDWSYFWKIFNSIVFKGTRSE